MKERLNEVGGNELEKFGRAVARRAAVWESRSKPDILEERQLQRLVGARRSRGLADFPEHGVELRRLWYATNCTNYILCLPHPQNAHICNWFES